MIHEKQLYPPPDEDDGWEEIPPGDISVGFGAGMIIAGFILILVSLAGVAKWLI